MIKVAVIDSGLCPIIKNKYFSKDIIDGCKIFIKDEEIHCEDDYLIDSTLHGTNCMLTLKSRYDNFNYYVVNVFDNLGRCNSIILLTALEHLLKIDVDIICISLATSEERYKDEFQTVCNNLFDQNKIIISSFNNITNKGYPASLKNVYGVHRAVMPKSNEYYINKNKNIQIKCDGTPEYDLYTDSYSMFKGNSKATPIFCTIVANMMDKYPKHIIRDKIIKNGIKYSDI